MDVIHDLTTSDLELFRQFVRTHFHDRHILLHEAFFDWQYKNSPYNTFSEYSVKIIKHKGEVLGYCGVVPVQLQIGDTTTTAGIFANLLVDEKIRGFGFGTLLVKEILKEFPFSFVNGYSEKLKKVCQKMPDWSEMGDLTRMLGILNDKKVQQLASGDVRLESIPSTKRRDPKLHRIRDFDKEMDIFWEKAYSRYPITVVRDQKYMNWRYAKHPLLNYEIYQYVSAGKVSAYAVIRIEEFTYVSETYKAARIIDLVCLDSVEDMVIQALITEYAQRKFDFIDYFFSGSPYSQALTRMGFVNASTIVGSRIPVLLNPVDHSRAGINWVIHSSHATIARINVTNPDNWYVTKGDGDQDRPNFT